MADAPSYVCVPQDGSKYRREAFFSYLLYFVLLESKGSGLLASHRYPGTRGGSYHSILFILHVHVSDKCELFVGF